MRRITALAPPMRRAMTRSRRAPSEPSAGGTVHPDRYAAARELQANRLEAIDLTEHNLSYAAPSFARLESQGATAAQCEDPVYLEWCLKLQGWDAPHPPIYAYNRKLWEWAYIAEAVRQANLLQPRRRALGFGVGTEPLPAIFASSGLSVLATDQEETKGSDWAATGELATEDLSGLSRPHLISDEDLASRVQTQRIDITELPSGLGVFDVIWSSCVIEHLGTPQRGLDFVVESCRLLEPGGIAIHTTELELTRRDTTADYGHCAVYRIADLKALGKRLADVGCSTTFNFTIPLDTPQDRWISMLAQPCAADIPDTAHLKLALGDSVSTSFGLLIRRDH